MCPDDSRARRRRQRNPGSGRHALTLGDRATNPFPQRHRMAAGARLSLLVITAVLTASAVVRMAS